MSCIQTILLHSVKIELFLMYLNWLSKAFQNMFKQKNTIIKKMKFKIIIIIITTKITFKQDFPNWFFTLIENYALVICLYIFTKILKIKKRELIVEVINCVSECMWLFFFFYLFLVLLNEKKNLHIKFSRNIVNSYW